MDHAAVLARNDDDMGYSIIVPIVVEMTITNAAGKLAICTPSEWRSKTRRQLPGMGTPNAANLGRYIEGFEASTRAGGPNAHLGTQTVVSARIVRQSTGEVLASFPTPPGAR